MRERLKKRPEGRKGVLTIEAAIILPIFIMVMMFILSILKLFYFHLVMQQALQNVGSTLSQYGYVVNELIDIENFALNEKTKNAESGIVTSVDKFLDTGAELAVLVKGNLSLDNISTIISKGQTLMSDANAVVDAVKNAANKDIIINYLLVSAMNGVGGYFVEWMTKDYVTAMGTETSVLQDFEYAFYVEPGTKDFLLVVEYGYQFPMFIQKPIRIQQAIRVHPWIGGSNTEGLYGSLFDEGN